MPTIDEFEELKSYCTWTWITQNGVNGYKIVSKQNNNSIFMPAAGCSLGNAREGEGVYGYYWSSSIYLDNLYQAYFVYFGTNGKRINNDLRYYGRSVRPVCPK